MRFFPFSLDQPKDANFLFKIFLSLSFLSCYTFPGIKRDKQIVKVVISGSRGRAVKDT